MWATRPSAREVELLNRAEAAEAQLREAQDRLRVLEARNHVDT